MKSFSGDSRQLTFICDREKGILVALYLEFPYAYVRYCAKHILANVKGKHSRVEISSPFLDKRDFEDVMAIIKGIDVGVYETLKKIHPKFPSRHPYGQNHKSDHTTNSETKCFNGWLGDQ